MTPAEHHTAARNLGVHVTSAEQHAAARTAVAYQVQTTHGDALAAMQERRQVIEAHKPSSVLPGVALYRGGPRIAQCDVCEVIWPCDPFVLAADGLPWTPS